MDRMNSFSSLHRTRHSTTNSRIMHPNSYSPHTRHTPKRGQRRHITRPSERKAGEHRRQDIAAAPTKKTQRMRSRHTNRNSINSNNRRIVTGLFRQTQASYYTCCVQPQVNFRCKKPGPRRGYRHYVTSTLHVISRTSRTQRHCAELEDQQSPGCGTALCLKTDRKHPTLSSGSPLFYQLRDGKAAQTQPNAGQQAQSTAGTTSAQRRDMHRLLQRTILATARLISWMNGLTEAYSTHFFCPGT
jgi:hypothetical protein